MTEMLNYLNINLMGLAQALAILVVAVLVGLIIERLLMRRLDAALKRTKWQGDDVLINALRGMTVLWALLVGGYFATLSADLSPDATTLILQTLFVVFGISVTVVAVRLGTGIVTLYYRDAGDGQLGSPSIFNNVVTVVIVAIGGLMIMQTLGISIAPALTALGVGGLAISLALQDTLANLFAGMQLVFARQIRAGHYVRLEGGQEGYVVDINWRTTKIRQLSNNMVLVPNSVLLSNIVTNYHDPETKLSVLIDVGVSYSSNLRHVERVTIEVASSVMQEVAGGIPEEEPFIRYNAFGDSSINFTVILKGKEYVDQYLIKHEFIMRLHERYEQEGIEIPFPIRTLHMQDASLTINGVRKPEAATHKQTASTTGQGQAR